MEGKSIREWLEEAFSGSHKETNNTSNPEPVKTNDIKFPDPTGKSFTEYLDEEIKYSLSRFQNGTPLFWRPLLANTTNIEAFEERLSEWCNEMVLNIIRIDCRNYYSHLDFCNYIKTLPTGNVILLSHVTEIPLGPEQNNIGWAINSCKNGNFFQFNATNSIVIATCRPRRLCQNYTDSALSGGGVFAVLDYTNLTKIVETDIELFLKSRDNIFVNERDLQMHLAIYLEKSGNYDSVEVEYYVPKSTLLPEYIWDSEMKVDIVVCKDGIFVPIELKYKTKAIEVQNIKRFGESIPNVQLTKNQAAQNIAKYDFWKDVRRLEILKKKFEKIHGGICLFLTNDESYQSEPRDNAKCANFSLAKDSYHGKDMSWGEDDASNIRPNFQLDKTYRTSWETISKIGLCYTIVKI